MRKLTICLFLIATSAFGQQEPQVTQFWNALTYYNPATGGYEFDHEAYAVVRDQWSNLTGNPSTQMLSYTAKLKKISSAVGGSYLHENIGLTDNHKAKFTYAYYLRLGRKSYLSFGLAAGVNYLKNSDKIIFLNPPNVNFYTPSYGFTADIGIAYRWRGLDVGISATQFPQSKYANGYRDAVHLFAHLGYDLQLSRLVKFRTQFFYKTDFNFSTIDLNMLLKFKDKVYVGVTNRLYNAWAIMAGWDIKGKFRVSYAYDMTFSKLNNGVIGATHEIGLGFMLKKRIQHLNIPTSIYF